MAPTSAPGPGSPPGRGSPLPHRYRDRVHPCQICTRTGLTPATSAPGCSDALALAQFVHTRCLFAGRVFCDLFTRRLDPCHRRASPIAEVRRRPLFPPAPGCIRLWFGRRRGSLFARSSLGGSLDLPTDVRIPSFLRSFRRSLGWSHGCFGWQQGVSVVTGGSCALDHRSDHNQTAAAAGPERQRRVVGMLAAVSHVISPTTPRVVAGPPARAVIRRR